MGSLDSIEFLDYVEKVNDEALYTVFSYFIDYKWQMESIYLWPMAMLNLYYVIIIDIYAICYTTRPNMIYLAFIELLLVVLIGFEFIKFYFEKSKLYFSNIKNLFDLVGQFLMLYYCLS